MLLVHITVKIKLPTLNTLCQFTHHCTYKLKGLIFFFISVCSCLIDENILPNFKQFCNSFFKIGKMLILSIKQRYIKMTNFTVYFLLPPSLLPWQPEYFGITGILFMDK